MGVAALHGFDQLVDDVPRRGLVGIAHAEVDHVLPALARGGLELAGDVEHIRRQAFDAGKLLHAGGDPTG